MRVLIAGGGIGGLTAALMLHARGIACEVHEAAATIREAGVGINTLPHAIRELETLGLLPALDAAGIRTSELIYADRFGGVVWREPRGLAAGAAAPQFSIHRGRLQAVVLRAVRERLGDGAVRTGRRLAAFEQDEAGVTAHFTNREGRALDPVRADALIGADGIHSAVRARFAPGEGPPSWNGMTMWRGAADWPAFLDGASMVVAGGMAAKVVLYPIGPGEREDSRLTNWVVCRRVGDAGTPLPAREDWSRPADLAAVLPHAAPFRLPWADLTALVSATPECFEYPMCDRDPLPRWSHGRVTLLGDAAHPMYPVGSNGASQAVLDARALADALAGTPGVPAALAAYEAERLPKTAEVVRLNREGGPEGVIDAVEALAPEGFEDAETVLPYAEREAIVRGYAKTAGFAGRGG